jgi:hypothetical protein
LILAGRAHANVPTEVFNTQVAAAVLVFRTLTYGIQIPLGAFTYVIWRLNKSWRKPVEAGREGEAAAAAASSSGGVIVQP